MERFDELLKNMADKEDCIVPEGFDARLQKALDGLPPRAKKAGLGAVKGALIAVAVCAALVCTAFAASPGLRGLLAEALARMYPLVAPLGVAFPLLKLRKLKSQWGNCHWAQGYITLNTALARCPEELRDYVALHELVHFLHHDHGPGFYARMDALMPDWRRRRKTLKGYSGALERDGIRKV